MTPAGTVRAEEIFIDTGGGGVDSGNDGDAGGVACGGGAVGVGEVDRPFGEALEVGGDDAGVAVEGGNVVVEIIDGDEEDVGLFRACTPKVVRRRGKS